MSAEGVTTDGFWLPPVIDPMLLEYQRRYSPLLVPIGAWKRRGDQMTGGMLNVDPVERARMRAEDAAERRARDGQIAALRDDKAAELQEHRRRLALATGLHEVMLQWHFPVWNDALGQWECEMCRCCQEYECTADGEWPCPTYNQVLANPGGSCP